jgi:hypothetical protein
LLEHIRSKCESHGIDPALAAARADIESFILQGNTGSEAPHRLAQGWRKMMVDGFE